MAEGKLSKCEIITNPNLTWGDLVHHKQKLLCEFGDAQTYLLHDLSEMNQKASKFHEVMKKFPALRSWWPSHQEFQKSYPHLKEIVSHSYSSSCKLIGC